MINDLIVFGNCIDGIMYKGIHSSTVLDEYHDGDYYSCWMLEADNSISFYKNDQFHNDHGPAYLTENGVVYFKNGKCHREDGPSIHWYIPGYEYWYYEGKKHREGGPAVISKFIKKEKYSPLNILDDIFYSGKRFANKKYNTHRYDTVLSNVYNSEEWYQHGILHREDGPAISFEYGSWLPFLRKKVRQYYVNGIRIDEETLKNNEISLDHTKWTDEHKVLFKLLAM